MIARSIETKLEEAFNPLELEIINESQKHAGHHGHTGGDETHFHVRAVAADFAGLNRMARQRAVYALLKDEFAAGLHALSLDLKTPEEAGL